MMMTIGTGAIVTVAGVTATIGAVTTMVSAAIGAAVSGSGSDPALD
jgi:hypothetical protein